MSILMGAATLSTEESMDQNKLEAHPDASWEAIDQPSLEDLERANDFKKPRKVR
jgi:hypothetical protein